MVSRDTFLAYLQVAAEHLGYWASFDLFPNGTYDDTNLKASISELPVARITLAKDPSAKTTDCASLFLSDTNRLRPHFTTGETILLIAAKRQDAIAGVMAQHDYDTNQKAEKEIQAHS